MNSIPEYFWDSCCFIRFVTRFPLEGTGELDQFVSDAKKGRLKIHFSTIVYAEFGPKYFIGKKHSRIEEFFADMGSAFIPHEPNPNIMIFAGRLRHAEPTNPQPSGPQGNGRALGAADAIHLATAVYLKEAYKLDKLIIHSFDEGRGKTYDGRCVPIVGFERWYPEMKRTPEVQKVCSIPKLKPQHPSPDLANRASK